MTWDAHHRRAETLGAVIVEANARRDGVLPMEMPGVAEAFGDELALIGALQLRWHTRLAGMIESALMGPPRDLESAVLSAWRRTATELPGIRAILEAHTHAPTSDAMARSLSTAQRKDWTLMAAMAGKASAQDASAAAVGRRIEEQARAAHDPTRVTPSHRAEPIAVRADSMIDRLKAHLVA